MKIHKPTGIGLNSGFGVPTAGTSGQILQKVNGTNYNTQWTDTRTPYYVQAGNSAGQTIPSGAVTTVTGWTTTANSVTGAWNATTGVFTCARAGWYRLRGAVSYVANTAAIGQEFNVIVSVNGVSIATGWTFRTTTSNVITAPPPIESIYYLNVNDTVSIRTYQDSGTTRSLSARADINLITIQELPNQIIK